MLIVDFCSFLNLSSPCSSSVYCLQVISGTVALRHSKYLTLSWLIFLCAKLRSFFYIKLAALSLKYRRILRNHVKRKKFLPLCHLANIIIFTSGKTEHERYIFKF